MSLTAFLHMYTEYEHVGIIITQMVLFAWSRYVLHIILQHVGNCQCYQSLNCGGSETVPAQSTLRDCCVNTNDGLSFRSGLSCTDCIGMRYLFILTEINLLY